MTTPADGNAVTDQDDLEPVAPADAGTTTPADAGDSDEEFADAAAEQTASTSENADTAGKDWNGEDAEAPEPTA